MRLTFILISTSNLEIFREDAMTVRISEVVEEVEILWIN